MKYRFPYEGTSDLIRRLDVWKEEGKSIIKKVYKSEEIYDYPPDKGPDLIIGYQKGFRASKQTALGEAPTGRLIEDNLEHWSGDHCCDPSFVPGVLFGVNLDKANIDLPDKISVKDVSSIVEKWIKYLNNACETETL